MDSSQISQPPKTEEELKQLILSLPKDTFLSFIPMYLYQGIWNPKVEATIAFQNHFQAQDTDIIVTSTRKVGTTWLKALIFSICNRSKHSVSQSPLATHNPHELVPQFESNIYAKTNCPDYLDSLEPPRLFGSHLPFELLPKSIHGSKCKIVYICRNPLDTLVSSWFFYSKLEPNLKNGMIEQYFDRFCQGKIPYGSFWDHVLGYWKPSLARPDKVLFVKYEELKADPVTQVRQLAEFVGFPFTTEENRGGVIEGIVSLCSFKNLKETEAAKRSFQVYPSIKNKWFFRNGEVADWVNHLTPSMVEKLEKIMQEKFRGSGVTFTYN